MDSTRLRSEKLYLLKLRAVTALFGGVSLLGWITFLVGWIPSGLIYFNIPDWYFAVSTITLCIVLLFKLTLNPKSKVFHLFYLLLHSTHVITGGMVLYTYGLALGSGYESSYTAIAILFSGALFIVVFSVFAMVCVSVIHRRQILLSYKEQVHNSSTVSGVLPVVPTALAPPTAPPLSWAPPTYNETIPLMST